MSTSSARHDPSPGDLIVALNDVRAWESETKRGMSMTWMHKGEHALLVATWMVGKQYRLAVLHNHRIMFFSHPYHTLHRNWFIANREPEMPVSSNVQLLVGQTVGRSEQPAGVLDAVRL